MDLLSAIMWLTLNIYHEVRGEDQIGQIAVAHVTLNRVHNRDQSVKEVVLAPYQFSWTLNESWTPKNMEALLECLESATVAIQGHDFTQGATHYHRADIHPYWADKMIYLGQFGDHKFYRKKVHLIASKVKKLRKKH